MSSTLHCSLGSSATVAARSHSSFKRSVRESSVTPARRHQRILPCNVPSSCHRYKLEDARHLTCPPEVSSTQRGADFVQFLGIFQRQIRCPSVLRFDQLDIDFGSVLLFMYELSTAFAGHDFLLRKSS